VKPKVICICGSSKFCDIMAVLGWFLERDEGAIVLNLHFLPGWYTMTESHLAEHEGVAEHMDKLHKHKINLADEVFVVNWGEYIGDSTKGEIEYAESIDRPIRYIWDDPYREKITALIDEVNHR
jgi:hypothetical protein